MKKYSVNVHYDIVKTYIVFEENEESAKKLAISKAEDECFDLNEWDLCDVDACIND